MRCGLPHAHAFETIAPYLECQTVRLELSSLGPVPTRFFYYCARFWVALPFAAAASADVRLCLCVRRPTFAAAVHVIRISLHFSAALAFSIHGTTLHYLYIYVRYKLHCIIMRKFIHKGTGKQRSTFESSFLSRNYYFWAEKPDHRKISYLISRHEKPRFL